MEETSKRDSRDDLGHIDQSDESSKGKRVNIQPKTVSLKSIKVLKKEAKALEKELVILKLRLERNVNKFVADQAKLKKTDVENVDLSNVPLTDELQRDVNEIVTRRKQLIQLFHEVSPYANDNWVKRGAVAELSEDHLVHYNQADSAKISQAFQKAQRSITELNEYYAEEKLARRATYADARMLGTLVGSLVFAVNLMIDAVQHITRWKKDTDARKEYDNVVKEIHQKNSQSTNKQKNSLFRSLHHSQSMLLTGSLNEIFNNNKKKEKKKKRHNINIDIHDVKLPFDTENKQRIESKQALNFHTKWKEVAKAVGKNDPDEDHRKGNSWLLWRLQQGAKFASRKLDNLVIEANKYLPKGNKSDSDSESQNRSSLPN